MSNSRVLLNCLLLHLSGLNNTTTGVLCRINGYHPVSRGPPAPSCIIICKQSFAACFSDQRLPRNGGADVNNAHAATPTLPFPLR